MKVIKYLPKFVRRVIATLTVMRESEYGGNLYNFLSAQTNNGDMTLIHKWEDDTGIDEAQSILQNEMNSGRDFVFIGAVKTGHSRGYMFLHSNKHRIWIRGFIPGIYEPLEAYRDTIDLAKKDARALGYHPRENT